MCGYDDHSLPPVTPGGGQGYHTGTSFGHLGVLYALIEREASGLGQLVDVAIHDALAVTIEMAFPYWHYQRSLVQRQTCRHAQPSLTQPALFKCADEKYLYMVLIINENKAWQSLVTWLSSHGLALDLEDERFADPVVRQREFQHIQGIVEAFMSLNRAEDMFREGQARGLPVGIVNAPEDLYEDRHLREREFFQEVQTEQFGVVKYPGPPYRFSSWGWRVQSGPPLAATAR
jgi:crotonobetainyl-CoA:carnitine CoA-transferase CaiB-like acyl-CoA transferase